MKTEHLLDVRFLEFCESPMRILNEAETLPDGHYLHVLHRMEDKVLYEILKIGGFSWHTCYGDTDLPVELFIWQTNDTAARDGLIADFGKVIPEDVGAIPDMLTTTSGRMAKDGEDDVPETVKAAKLKTPIVQVSGLSEMQVRELQKQTALMLEVSIVFCDKLKNGAEGPKMVVIPAGKFRMRDITGNGYSIEQPAHEAIIEKPFAIGVYPVTVGEFMYFTETTQYKTQAEVGDGFKWQWKKWKYANETTWRNPCFIQNSRHPVTVISKRDANAYCEWLSTQTAHEYRLATGTEWEYACRAGSEEDWCFGNDENRLKDYAWYSENSRGSTHPVGEKKPNAFGLYDFHGNVWEWTASGYEYKGQEIHNTYTVRGGSWDNGPYHLRSTAICLRGTMSCNPRIGFRLVRVF